jgi:hypothetical protein
MSAQVRVMLTHLLPASLNASYALHTSEIARRVAVLNVLLMFVPFEN